MLPLQVKRMLLATLQALAELRRQLLAPMRADLPRLAAQAGALAAALGTWVERYAGRTDEVGSAEAFLARQRLHAAVGGPTALLPHNRLLSFACHLACAVLPSRPAGGDAGVAGGHP